MRRCPRCYAVYDDRTSECGPCQVATVSYTDGADRSAPAPSPSSSPASPGETVRDPASEAHGPREDEPADGELLLAEADTAWIMRAAEALAREGIASNTVTSESDPGIVALYVPEQAHARAIDVVGEALDEPPALILERPPQAEEAAPEGEVGPEESPYEDPEPDPPPAPPVLPDPDQAAYCPECGEAYRAGFELCADCAVPLVPMGARKGP